MSLQSITADHMWNMESWTDQLSQPGTTAVLHMSKNKQIYMGAQSIKQCFWLGGCI
jgi:hypothetical protein